MKKSAFIVALFIILLGLSSCNSRVETIAEYVPNGSEITINDNASLTPSETPKPTDEPESKQTPSETPKPTDMSELDPNTYTYEVRARLHESLPEYRFVATGKTAIVDIPADDWSMAFVTSLNGYDENGSSILTADFTDVSNEVKGYPIYFQMIDTMGLHVVDVNFDGYKDVIILNCFSGAHSNSWYDCWLWDNMTSSFISSKSFAAICNPAIDWDKQSIYSSGGTGADNHDYSIYQYIDGQFVLSNQLHWNSSFAESEEDDDTLTAAGIYVKEEQLVNGNMKIVREGILPTEEADALLEHYNTEDPWKLLSPRWYMMGGHHADVWLEQ